VTLNREAVLVRAAGAEALDLAIDNARIDLPDLVVTKPQPRPYRGGGGVTPSLGLLAAQYRGLEIVRELLKKADVTVENMAIPRVVRMAGLQPSARVTRARIFDLHHFGPEPCEGFRA
jgi:hypothetical protein